MRTRRTVAFRRDVATPISEERTAVAPAWRDAIVFPLAVAVKTLATLIGLTAARLAM